MKYSKHILLVGGGSLGPVTPLLAMVRTLKKMDPSIRFTWIGTPTGPEGELMKEEGIPFFSLPVVKLTRYPSISWIRLPVDWMRVRYLAGKKLDELKPDVIVTVGGYTAVPVVYAASKRGIPCATHQLDLLPGLANRKIAPLCESVTTSFEYERAPFDGYISDERIATPSRFSLEHLPSRAKAARHFDLDPKKPILLVFGGGTGAQALNRWVDDMRKKLLSFTQIIHLTGRGKNPGWKSQSGYFVTELLTNEMCEAYAAADLVISRAGFATLSEMTAGLKKATIVVPLPGTEQELNARAFEERASVVIVPQDRENFADELLETARLLLQDKDERLAMGERAHAFMPVDDGSSLAKRVLSILKK